MKGLLQKLNWKNFVQRTLLFFVVFLIIRILVDLVEGDFSPGRIVQQSMIRYLIFAMVLGMLDSETWFNRQQSGETGDAPIRFSSTKTALLHYAGVAFFISLLCGFILTCFILLRWLYTIAMGQPGKSVFPNLGMYVLVISVIGICFACYDAFRNYRRLRQEKTS